MVNTIDVKATMDLIQRTWPKSQWTHEQQTETTRRIGRTELNYVQAEAALVNLSLKGPYKTIAPSEVLEALTRAARASTSSDDARGPKNHERDGCEALGDYPRWMAWLFDHDPNHPKLAAMRKAGTSLFEATRGLRGCPEKPDDERRAQIPPGGWRPEEAMWNGKCLLRTKPVDG